MKNNHFQLLVFLVALWFTACDSKTSEKAEDTEIEPIEVLPESPTAQPVPASPLPASPPLPFSEETGSAPAAEEEAAVPPPPKPKSQSLPQPITISRAYQEGYDKGYDDGEDDAISGNGFGGQYDDSCPYKGKRLNDYEEGYGEGYEAGYYDNATDE